MGYHAGLFLNSIQKLADSYNDWLYNSRKNRLHFLESVEIFERICGKKKFQKSVLDVIGERGTDFTPVTFGITHTGNVEEAEALKQEIIERLHPKDIIVSYMGATMGTYAGKDGMIISFYS